MQDMNRGVLLFLALGLGLAGAPREAPACGGNTATIAGDPRALGVREVPWRAGLTHSEDAGGAVVLPASAVKISGALAGAIARR